MARAHELQKKWEETMDELSALMFEKNDASNGEHPLVELEKPEEVVEATNNVAVEQSP